MCLHWLVLWRPVLRGHDFLMSSTVAALSMTPSALCLQLLALMFFQHGFVLDLHCLWECS